MPCDLVSSLPRFLVGCGMAALMVTGCQPAATPGGGQVKPPTAHTKSEPAPPAEQAAPADHKTSALELPLTIPPQDEEPLARTVPRPSENVLAARRAMAQLVAASTSQGDAAQSEMVEQWAAAEKELQRLGTDALPVYVEALGSDQEVVRELASIYIAQLGPAASPATKTLIRCLTDSSQFVQANAASCLSTIPGQEDLVGRTLTRLLGAQDANVRLIAAASLSNVPEQARAALPQLIAKLDDTEGNVREAAARTIGTLGPEAKSAIASLQVLADQGSEPAGVAAAAAIRQIKGTASPDVATQTSGTLPE